MLRNNHLKKVLFIFLMGTVWFGTRSGAASSFTKSGATRDRCRRLSLLTIRTPYTASDTSFGQTAHQVATCAKTAAVRSRCRRLASLAIKTSYADPDKSPWQIAHKLVTYWEKGKKDAFEKYFNEVHVEKKFNVLYCLAKIFFFKNSVSAGVYVCERVPVVFELLLHQYKDDQVVQDALVNKRRATDSLLCTLVCDAYKSLDFINKKREEHDKVMRMLQAFIAVRSDNCYHNMRVYYAIGTLHCVNKQYSSGIDALSEALRCYEQFPPEGRIKQANSYKRITTDLSRITEKINRENGEMRLYIDAMNKFRALKNESAGKGDVMLLLERFVACKSDNDECNKNVYNALAFLHGLTGEYDKAIHYLSQVIVLHEKGIRIEDGMDYYNHLIEARRRYSEKINSSSGATRTA